MLARLGTWCFRNRWKVLAGWLALVVVVFGAGAVIGSAFDGAFEIPASESRRGFDALDEHFGGVGSGQSGSIVFRAEQGVQDPAVQSAMEGLFSRVAAIEGVSVTSPYEEFGAQQVSADGMIAYATVTLAVDIDMTESTVIGQTIIDEAPAMDGLTVEVGGQALAPFEPPQSEFVGLAFAVVVLILAFGSVLAMGLPIGVAVAGVGVGAGLIALISNLQPVPDFATTLGAMIGLGVGIDYALIIVTRYREGLASGLTPEAATERALDTAGRAVFFAGITVVISLLGMLLMGLSFVSGLGIGAATVVAVTMLASLTLLPAFLGFAGHRVEITRWPELIAAALLAAALLGAGLGLRPLLFAAPAAVLVFVAGLLVPALRVDVPRRPRRALRDSLAYRWSRLVQSHPWTGVIAGAGVLLLLAAPVLSLRMGFSDEGNFGEDTTTRRAYDMLGAGFGPGFNGPLLVTLVLGQPSDRDAVAAVHDAIASAPGVANVGPPLPSDRAQPASAAAYLIQVIPTTSPQDRATDELVELLRRSAVPSAVAGSTLAVSVTGNVAVGVDFTSYLSGRILIFFGAVLALSFLLLMAVFRSVLVPIKAVLMNVLSIGAAYGIVVAVFQWGWLGGWLGITGGPIEPFLPMMMFAIVFGLSMDYEVFLLSRVKEEFDRTGDPVGSVADGLASTAHVITAAAAIMVVVFGSFMFEDQRIIKLFGLGLAVAVLLDATLVRMLLVPATMKLLGRWNWWLPSWLDRALPRIHVEGQREAAPDAGIAS
ncbi:MAG: MMPL family transporter [Chloroflexi bacterium]|nr:MMPL family transporter [Chloroflexota bacterium]